MTGLKVGFLCQWFTPEPVLQPGWIVEALSARGADVRVLTAFPNYPSGKVHAGFRPWFPTTETVGGLRIHRAPVYPSHDQSARGRMANYLSWAASSAALGVRWFRGADVTLVYSSPATAALAAMVLRRLRGVPYVLLIQDLWPDSVTSSGFVDGRAGRVMERAITAFVRRTYAAASHIAVISPGMKELLVSRGVQPSKVSVVQNWVREVPPAPSAGLRQTLGLTADDFVLMYAGNHGAAQNLSPVIEAFRQLEPATDPPHLVLVGDGVEKTELLRAAGGSRNVHAVDPVPAGVVAAWSLEADAQLVSLADRPIFRATTPSKLQAILAAGRPVVAVARGDVAATVITADCGVVAEPGDHRGLVDAVRNLAGRSVEELSAMGARGRACYESTMAEDVGATALLSHLESAAKRRESKGRGGWR